jgi:membrane-associated protein
VADDITHWVEGAMGSPWVFAALFAFAMVDAFFPAVPSETLVITAGVYAAADGEPVLWGVILAAAAGAFAGDHISYLIGHLAGDRLQRRERARRLLERGGALLDRRGGSILIVCRYIPGARTAVTLTSGASRYRLRSFSAFDAIAALSWGLYSGLIGYIGGEAFEQDPIKGVGVGLAIAFTLAGIVELVRHRRGRKAAAS